jgi:hypothetical protein
MAFARSTGSSLVSLNISGLRTVLCCRFDACGIELRFSHFTLFVYDAPGYVFESSLSILDVLTWSTAALVRNAIRDLQRLTAS